VKACKLPDNVGLDDLGVAARQHSIRLYAATDGNHGRAVAKMAKTLGIGASIYVPNDMDQPTRDFITGEGAQMFVVDGDYDKAVITAALEAKSVGGTLVQDTAFDGYSEIPKVSSVFPKARDMCNKLGSQWIVDGYSTMLREIDEQLDTTSHMIYVTPVGVGSLAEAVVTYCKTTGRNSTVLAVEPHSAACLWESLHAGQSTTIQTRSTIMSGMNCGTVSTAAWPILKAGLDASVTISDDESHEAIVYLRSMGVAAGPCGAASLAALRYVARANPVALHLTPNSKIILICSEGARIYHMPRSS
jgi:diaminopropionate ammonia-lyase family